MEKKVYQDTTRPLPRVSRARYYNKHDKSDLGEDFVAPDAGWAWLVCVAAGVSNVGKTKPIHCTYIYLYKYFKVIYGISYM